MTRQVPPPGHGHSAQPNIDPAEERQLFEYKKTIGATFNSQLPHLQYYTGVTKGTNSYPSERHQIQHTHSDGHNKKNFRNLVENALRSGKKH